MFLSNIKIAYGPVEKGPMPKIVTLDLRYNQINRQKQNIIQKMDNVLVLIFNKKKENIRGANWSHILQKKSYV